MLAITYEGKSVMDLVAWCASCVAVWAAAKADAYEALEYRVRHPFAAALRHPIQTLERKFNSWLLP